MTIDEMVRETENPSPTARTIRHRERQPLLTSVVGSYSVPEWLGRFNTEEEVDYVAAKVIDVVKKLRELSPLYEMAKEGIDLTKVQWAAH